jgi:hypothetical protein
LRKIGEIIEESLTMLIKEAPVELRGKVIGRGGIGGVELWERPETGLSRVIKTIQ